MKQVETCGCFPTGKHYPGIAHLIKVRAVGVASEIDAAKHWVECPIAFLDVETTGRDSKTERVVEIGIVLGEAGQVRAKQSWLLNPQKPIPKEISAIHGITDDDVKDQPTFAEVAHELLAMLTNAVPAAYNASFDRAFLMAELERAGIRPADPPPAVRREVDWIDPLTFARELYKDEESRALGDMAARLGIELTRAHRATDDAEAALMVLYALSKNPKLPKTYGALIQEQRRLSRAQDDVRRMWRKS